MNFNPEPINVRMMGNYEEIITTEPKETAKRKRSNGRASNDEIERRRNIAKRLYYTFSWKNTEEFLRKYKDEIERYNRNADKTKQISVRTEETLKNDMYVCNIPEAHQCIASKHGPLKNAFNKCIFEISQVRFTCANIDYCIYRAPRKSVFSKQKLTEQIDILEQQEMNQQISHTTFVHLYIIFKSTGFEDYIKRIYCDNYDKILYVAKHEKCIEIVFEFRHIKFLLQGTRRALRQSLLESNL